MSAETSRQRAEKRRATKRKTAVDTAILPDTPLPIPYPIAQALDDNMSLRRILVISLGNPGQYRDTYHSAGHIVLQSLQRMLGRDQPSFATQRIGKTPALASIGLRYSLLQSPEMMNLSGRFVAQAYRRQVTEGGLSPAEVGVVLVHDDLEEDMGVVKIRDWKSSHRGHNGIKSVNSLLKPDPAGKWARISVGIGRPDSRDGSVVSDWVLSKIPRKTKDQLEQRGAQGVLDALAELDRKWGGGYGR